MPFAELETVQLKKTHVEMEGTAHGLNVEVMTYKDNTQACVIGKDGMRLPLEGTTAAHIANAYERQLSTDMWSKVIDHVSNLMFPEEYTE